MTDVATFEVEKLLLCPFCGSSASEFPVDAVNCDNRDCDASVYVVGRETWQRRAAIQQAKDRAGEIAAGSIFGIPLVIDPAMPPNAFRIENRPAPPAEVSALLRQAHAVLMRFRAQDDDAITVCNRIETALNQESP